MNRACRERSGRRCLSHPPRDLDADLLEVMVEVHPATRSMHIFHVMRAQQKHLDRMGEAT